MNEYLKRFVLLLVSIVVLFMATGITFNHLDPWIGIVVFVGGLVYIVNRIIKTFEEDINEKI